MADLKRTDARVVWWGLTKRYAGLQMDGLRVRKDMLWLVAIFVEHERLPASLKRFVRRTHHNAHHNTSTLPSFCRRRGMLREGDVTGEAGGDGRLRAR